MNGPLKLLEKFYLCSTCSQNLNYCSLARAPQIFALLASSQSKFFISAHARKKIAVLGMLANARKDHSSPLNQSNRQPNLKQYYQTNITDRSKQVYFHYDKRTSLLTLVTRNFVEETEGSSITVIIYTAKFRK